MSELRYRGYHVEPELLQVGECTVRATKGDSADYWRLWFYVNRETDGQPEMMGVPLNVNGGWNESGPGGKTWGFNRAEPGAWQVSPSINVLATRDVHPGEHPAPSLWHQTPTIVGVPDGEPWQAGAP